MPRPALASILLCALLVSTMGVACPPEGGGAPSESGLSDEFDGSSLDPKWSWRNAPYAYDVGATTAGHLHIVSNRNTNFHSTTSNGSLVYQSASGNFSIHTRVRSDPQRNFEKAGLMVWQDANNWVALKYQQENGKKVQVSVRSGGSQWSDVMTSVSASPIDLRLERDGGAFTAYYSTDGAAWTSVWSSAVAINDSVWVGLLVADGNANTNYPADFDFFHFGPPNRAPAIIQPFSPIEVREDERVGVSALEHFSDPDGDELTFEVSDSPHVSGSFNCATGVIEVYGAPNWNGAEFITIKASDKFGEWAMAQLRVTVTPVEDAPIVKEAIKDVSMLQGGRDDSINLSRVFYDNDTIYGDSLKFSVENNGSIWVAIAGSGRVTLNCPVNFYGVLTMTFIAIDGTELSASAPCKVTVAHVNQPPQVKTAPPPILVNEDESVEVDMGRAFIDPEGEALSLAFTGNRQIVIEPLDGLNISIAPLPDASGFTEDIAVTAADPYGLSAQTTLSVTVIPVNDPPRILARSPTGNATVSEGESLEFCVTASDPEMGPVVGLNWYFDGEVVHTGTPSYIYTANYSSAGDHTVTVAVDDGEFVERAGWSLRVLSVNRDPMDVRIVSPKSGQVFKQGDSVPFQGCATDPDGDPLTFQWVEGVTVLGTGANFTARGLSTGAHTIFLQVSDEDSVVKSAAVQVTIRPNAMPRIVSFAPADGQRFKIGARVEFRVEAVDDDGDPLSLAWYDGPELLSNATFFIKDDLGMGAHTIRLLVSDGRASAEMSFTIEIYEPAPEGVNTMLIAIGAAAAAMVAIVAGFWLWTRRKERGEE